MRTLFLFVLLILVQDWPEFRGPTGQGFSEQQGLPLTWSETQNVRWKTRIPGKGWSSPTILDERIWLTTATEEGGSLRALSVDLNTGALLQNLEVIRLKSRAPINEKNSYASPTPVLDGDRIYLHFGAFWNCLHHTIRRNRMENPAYDNGQHGPGGSPVLYDNLLIVSCDGRDVQYVVALDKQTGSHVVWTHKRGVSLTPSPLLVGDELYLVSDNGIATCLDARTGNEHWRVRIGGNLSVSPIYADGRIYFLSEEAESVVIAPGREFKKLATNQLDGRSLASMAVSQGSIFVRTQTHLYCLSEQ